MRRTCAAIGARAAATSNQMVAITMLLFGTSGTGCSPAPSPSTTSAQQVIGPAGGTLATSDGSSLTIPPGALPIPTLISMTPAPTTSLPWSSGATPGGSAFVLAPEGQRFAIPITIALRFSPAQLPIGTALSSLRIYTAPQGTRGHAWALPTRLLDDSRLSAQTMHFSVFQVVTATPGSPDPTAGAQLVCLTPNCSVPCTCNDGSACPNHDVTQCDCGNGGQICQGGAACCTGTCCPSGCMPQPANTTQALSCVTDAGDAGGDATASPADSCVGTWSVSVTDVPPCGTCMRGGAASFRITVSPSLQVTGIGSVATIDPNTCVISAYEALCGGSSVGAIDLLHRSASLTLFCGCMTCGDVSASVSFVGR